MADIQLSRALPVLPVREIEAATAFYRDVLGFDLAFHMSDYAGVSRGPVELHLDASTGATSPVSARIDTVGIDALFAQVEPSGAVKPDERLETKPWGCGSSVCWTHPGTASPSLSGSADSLLDLFAPNF